MQSWGLLKRLIMRFRIAEDLDEMEKKLDDFRLNFVVRKVLHIDLLC
jgi:hypothetical protein